MKKEVDCYVVDMTKYPPIHFNREEYTDEEWEEVLKCTTPAITKKHRR